MDKGNPLRYRPVKKPLTIVVLLQLLFVVSLFAEVSLVLTRDNQYFTNDITRATMVVYWWMSLIWLITILIAVFGVASNSYWLIFPNIIYCTLLCLPSLALLTMLMKEDTRSWSLLYSFIECCILFASVYQETRCFIQMRDLLSE